MQSSHVNVGGETFSVLVSTWNMGNAKPPRDLTDWLGGGKDYDIVAIGAQEADWLLQKKEKDKSEPESGGASPPSARAPQDGTSNRNNSNTSIGETHTTSKASPPAGATPATSDAVAETNEDAEVDGHDDVTGSLKDEALKGKSGDKKAKKGKLLGLFKRMNLDKEDDPKRNPHAHTRGNSANAKPKVKESEKRHKRHNEAISAETGQRTSTNAKASSDNKKAKKDTSRKRATTGPSRFFLPRSTMSDSDDSVDYDPNPIPGFDSFTGLPKRISGPKKVTQNTVAGTAAASAAGFLVMGPVGAVIAGGSAFTVLKTTDAVQDYMNNFFDRISTAMGDDYVEVAKTSLLEIKLIVLVRKKVANRVRKVVRSKEATGLGDIVGNKGGTAVKLTIGDTTICFVSAHLAAHEGEKFRERRNTDVCDIINGMWLKGPKLLDLTNYCQHVFWMGDLNYRVALDYHIPEAVGWSHEKKWAHVTQMVKDGKSKELLAYDELIHEHAAMRVFGNFQEGEIGFEPTFKVLRNEPAGHYLEQRVPSFCDRILFHSAPSRRSNVAVVEYRNVPSLMTSDHKPVTATFALTIPRPIKKVKKQFHSGDYYTVEFKTVSMAVVDEVDMVLDVVGGAVRGLYKPKHPNMASGKFKKEHSKKSLVDADRSFADTNPSKCASHRRHLSQQSVGERSFGAHIPARSPHTAHCGHSSERTDSLVAMDVSKERSASLPQSETLYLDALEQTQGELKPPAHSEIPVMASHGQLVNMDSVADGSDMSESEYESDMSELDEFDLEDTLSLGEETIGADEPKAKKKLLTTNVHVLFYSRHGFYKKKFYKGSKRPFKRDKNSVSGEAPNAEWTERKLPTVPMTLCENPAEDLKYSDITVVFAHREITVNQYHVLGQCTINLGSLLQDEYAYDKVHHIDLPILKYSNKRGTMRCSLVLNKSASQWKNSYGEVIKNRKQKKTERMKAAKKEPESKASAKDSKGKQAVHRGTHISKDLVIS